MTVPLTSREKRERSAQRRLLAEHQRIVKGRGYQRRVERAQARAREQEVAKQQAEIERAALAFERELRAHYEPRIQAEVAKHRALLTERARSKGRRMAAREVAAKLRAWPTRSDAADDLGVSVSTLSRWVREGASARRAGEIRGEHARRKELAKLQSAYLAAGKKVLRSESTPSEGLKKFQTFRRVGTRWRKVFRDTLLSPRAIERLHAFLLRKKVTHWKYWQATAMLVVIVPAGEGEDIQYSAYGGQANYGRVVSTHVAQADLGVDAILDVPVQTRYHDTLPAMAGELRAHLLEALADYGALMLDTLEVNHFEFR